MQQWRAVCDYYDGSHILYVPLILPAAAFASRITYWRHMKSSGNSALIMLHFWFTFESHFDCIRWILTKKKKKKSRSEYISAELESSSSLSLPCSSIYHLIIQSENENWSLKHLYLNKEREADYEFSKCNFYYTSIILPLITDSFSLCSSSKTCSYSIHVNTGTKKKLAWLFEMFNLWKI